MLDSVKRQAWIILEALDKRRPVVRWTNALLMGLIVANVLAAVFETVDEVFRQAPGFFYWFEVASVAVFTIEYLTRLWSCTADERYRHPVWGRLRWAVSPMGLVDLVAILPFYLMVFGLTAPDTRALRAFRLFRVLRLMKMGRYSFTLQVMGRVFRDRREELVVSLITIGVLLLVSSTLMYYAENEAQPEAFSSIPTTMWWGVATLTTVGYGDLAPVTPLGRLLGGVVAVLGIGLFALPAGILSAGFSDELQQRRQAKAEKREQARRLAEGGGAAGESAPEPGAGNG